MCQLLRKLANIFMERWRHMVVNHSDMTNDSSRLPECDGLSYPLTDYCGIRFTRQHARKQANIFLGRARNEVFGAMDSLIEFTRLLPYWAAQATRPRSSSTRTTEAVTQKWHGSTRLGNGRKGALLSNQLVIRWRNVREGTRNVNERSRNAGSSYS